MTSMHRLLGSGIVPDPTGGLVYPLSGIRSRYCRCDGSTIGFHKQVRNGFNLQLFGNRLLGYQKNHR